MGVVYLVVYFCPFCLLVFVLRLVVLRIVLFGYCGCLLVCLFVTVYLVIVIMVVLSVPVVTCFVWFCLMIWYCIVRLWRYRCVVSLLGLLVFALLIVCTCLIVVVVVYLLGLFGFGVYCLCWVVLDWLLWCVFFVYLVTDAWLFTFDCCIGHVVGFLFVCVCSCWLPFWLQVVLILCWLVVYFCLVVDGCVIVLFYSIWCCFDNLCLLCLLYCLVACLIWLIWFLFSLWYLFDLISWAVWFFISCRLHFCLGWLFVFVGCMLVCYCTFGFFEVCLYLVNSVVIEDVLIFWFAWIVCDFDCYYLFVICGFLLFVLVVWCLRLFIFVAVCLLVFGLIGLLWLLFV